MTSFNYVVLSVCVSNYCHIGYDNYFHNSLLNHIVSCCRESDSAHLISLAKHAEVVIVIIRSLFLIGYSNTESF